MGPKVKSAILFAEARGEKAIMTSIDRRLDVLKGKAGTTVYK
jgi:carbamate kinase